eukprot:scaffold8100_cov66-Cyclotella_meneghiniana.AAC.4
MHTHQNPNKPPDGAGAVVDPNKPPDGAGAAAVGQGRNSQPNNPPDGAGAAAAPPNENPVLNGGGFPAGVCGVSGGVDGAPPPKLNADEAVADVPPPVVEAGVDVPKVVVVEGPQVDSGTLSKRGSPIPIPEIMVPTTTTAYNLLQRMKTINDGK